jgi:hypothetical protein
VEKTPGSGSHSEKRSAREEKWKLRALRTVKNGGRPRPVREVIQREQRLARGEKEEMGEQTPEWSEARQNWRKASPGRQTGNRGQGTPAGGAAAARSADSVGEGRAGRARAKGGWAGVGRSGGCWDRGGGRRRAGAQRRGARLSTLILSLLTLDLKI